MLDGIIVLFHSVSSILNIMGLVYGLALLVNTVLSKITKQLTYRTCESPANCLMSWLQFTQI